MASPQSVLPCPWLAFRDTPRCLPATRTNGPDVATWPLGCHHPNRAPEARLSTMRSRRATDGRPDPVRCCHRAAFGPRSEPGQDQRRAGMCSGGCIAGAVGPIPGNLPGPAFRHRSGERQDPQAIAVGPSWPAHRSGRQRQGPRAVRTTRILAASSGRGPVRGDARCRRSSPRAATSRSQQRCRASPSDMPPETPKRSRRRPDDALHQTPERRWRPRGSLSGVRPDLGPVASAQHRRCVALASSDRIPGSDRSPSRVTDPRWVARAQHAHRSTWSSSLKARVHLGVRRPGAVRTSIRGSAVLPPPRPATLSRRVEPQYRVPSARGPPRPYEVRFPGGPPMGFRCPTTLAEAGSDLHRAYQPGCAAPPGFLSLLTLCSARNLSGLVSCR
jgi:hypothetical protein